jgi:hypothetical protein
MSELDKKNEPRINELAPSETAGRDTIARFQAQFRAAAYECLAILDGKTIDRVYCDYHDDFVARHQSHGKTLYHFFQVKTKDKKTYQWTKLDIFGLTKKHKCKPEKLAASFGGKLLLHTIRFKNACGNVVFLTNIQVNDEVDGVATSLAASDFSNDVLVKIIEGFNEAFCPGDPLSESLIHEKLKRLSFKSGLQHLDPHAEHFDALAREAIFKFSEIDLENLECKEIIENLVALVHRKSFQNAIATMTEGELDDAAGIGIADLLEILSISKGAYQALMAGGDPQAIRNASIIQRKLLAANASNEIIEYCSKWKVAWDVWLRDKRHILAEFDLNFLLDDLNSIKNGLTTGKTSFGDIQVQIEDVWKKVSDKGMDATLSRDLLVGGVLSALVRSEAQ